MGGERCSRFVAVLILLNLANALMSRALISFWLGSIPSNSFPFLIFHTWSHRIAPNRRRSSPLTPRFESDGGYTGDHLHWLSNHRSFVSGHLVKRCSTVSFSELHWRHKSSGGLVNFPIFYLVGRQSASIFDRCTYFTPFMSFFSSKHSPLKYLYW